MTWHSSIHYHVYFSYAANFAHFILFILPGATFDGTGSYELSIAVCTSLLIIACFMYVSVPLRSKFKRSKQPITALHHHIVVDHSSDEEPECQLRPIPNLVAPIGGIVSILVASQESLNQLQNDEDIVHTRDSHDWSDNDLSPDLAEHPIRVCDLKRDKDVGTPLSNSLTRRLTSLNDVVIYLPQSSIANSTEQSISTDCLLTQSDVGATGLDDTLILDINGEKLMNNVIQQNTNESQSGTPQSLSGDHQIIPTPDDEPVEDLVDEQSCTGTINSDSAPNSSWNTPPHISMIENPLIGCLDDRATIERFSDLHEHWLSPMLLENPQSEVFDDWVDSNITSNEESPNDCTVFDVLMMSEHGTQTEQSSICEESNDHVSVSKDINESDNTSYDLEESASSSYEQSTAFNTINEQIKAMKEIFNQFNTYDDNESIMSPSVTSVDSNGTGAPEIQMIDFSIDTQEVTYKSYGLGI